MSGEQTIIRPRRPAASPPGRFGRGGTVVRAEAAVSGLESLVFAVAPTLVKCIEVRASGNVSSAEIASELQAFEYRATRGGVARAQVETLRPVLSDAMQGDVAGGAARIERLLQDSNVAPDLLEALHHCVCVGMAGHPSLEPLEQDLYERLGVQRDCAAGPLSSVRHGDSAGFSVLGPRVTARSIISSPLVMAARALDRLRADRVAVYPVLGPPGSGKSSLLTRLSAATGPLCLFVESGPLVSSAPCGTGDGSTAALSGVVVTFDATGLVNPADTPRIGDLQSTRQQLRHLDALIGAHLPVYVVVTKADRIRGFHEYFADLDERERGQLWGVTFAVRDSHSGRALRTLPVTFDALTARLHRGLTRRLHDQRSGRDRELLYVFPRRVAALKTGVLEHLEQLVGATPGTAHLFLRGVYLTSSGTTASDRGWYIEALARDVLLQERRLFRRGRPHLKW